MLVITVCQNKGGEGKTTVSRLLIEHAAKSALRVLVIDMDPQCNLSQRFLGMEPDPSNPGRLPPVHPDFESDDVSWDGRSSVVDIYRPQGHGVYPYPTKYSSIELIPGHSQEMRRLELVREDEVAERIHDRMSSFLGKSEVQESYDLVVIDTPPSKGPLTISAIRAATHILIPCQMEQQSVEGLRDMIQLWRRENRGRSVDRQIQNIGILPNKVRAVGLHQGVLEGLRMNPGIAPHLIPLELGLRSAFAEADHPEAKPKSVFELPAGNKALQEAQAVCHFVFEKAGIGSVH